MEENIIIKSTRTRLLKIALFWILCTVTVITVLYFSIFYPKYKDECDMWRWNRDHYYYRRFATAHSCGMKKYGYLLPKIMWIPIITSLSLFGIFVFATIQMQIIVTDKRVYGKTYFGRSIDLPMDSITAISSGWFKQITISTSSGKISFCFIKNAKDIHKEVRDLIMERQEQRRGNF